MQTIKVQVTTKVYADLKQAIQNSKDLSKRQVTVEEWIEEQLNNNTQVVIEVLSNTYKPYVYEQ